MRGARTILFHTWYAMKKRCSDPKAVGYKHYGGRGIKVCARWRDSFDAFVEDMGPRPEGAFDSGRSRYSIDRIDVNGDYEPSNCRWATMEEQKRNRTDNRWLTIGGRTMIATDWAREVGISTELLSWRLKRMSPEEAIRPEKTKAVRAERNPRTKMTWEIARAIRASSKSALALAKHYGISDTLVAQVRLGQRWVESGMRPAARVDHGRKLTREQAADIRRLAQAGQSFRALGRQFSVSESTVRQIARGNIWKAA
jgi:hypothetical protein